MHKCTSYYQCIHCERRQCTADDCRREFPAETSRNMVCFEVGWICPGCMITSLGSSAPEKPMINIAEAEHPRRLADKLLALREAWLDLPFQGIVPPGWGDPIQHLVNAVTEIIDPDRKLRETDEAKRRGDIATLRTQAEWHAEQVALGTKANQTAEEIAIWAGERDAAIAECRERFGVDIIIPKREPWQP